MTFLNQELAVQVLAELRSRGFWLDYEGSLDAPPHVLEGRKLLVWPGKKLTVADTAQIRSCRDALLFLVLKETQYWRNRLQGKGRLGRISAAYQEYLQSDRWRAYRQYAIDQAGSKCQHCASANNLQVHHVDYTYVGEETLEDVQVLCKPCHDQADRARRAEKTAARGGAAERRFQGWARKVYGEGWENYEDYDTVYEEFQEWLERKGYAS